VEGAAERGALVEAAEEFAARWGCPRAGHRPPAELPPDLAQAHDHVAHATGADLAPTCPWSQCSGEWVHEVCDAVALAVEWQVPIADTLGRALTAADTQALVALRQSQIAAQRADIEHLRRQAERERAKANPRGGGRR
jgi:hypothetical protein